MLATRALLRRTLPRSTRLALTSTSAAAAATSAPSQPAAAFSAAAAPAPPAFHALQEETLSLADATKGADKALLYFTATWCGPCKAIAPTFAAIAAAHGGAVRFVKIDIDDNPAATEEHAIRSVPTFKAVSKGKVVKTWSGASTEALKAGVAELAALA